jgi:hypothetical protein
MAAFDSDAFDTGAFSADAFDFGAEASAGIDSSDRHGRMLGLLQAMVRGMRVIVFLLLGSL